MQTPAPTQVTTLPPIARPPHDPTSWLLNGYVGWLPAKLDQIEYLPPTKSLVLPLAPGSRRSLTEPSGSFGGLTTPGNAAVGPDGTVYLLDAESAQLKRFDPCECSFQNVPYFGGVGDGPRQLTDPHGIGICSGNLFVCDTGNHRLSVFALHGVVLRGHWQPPAAAYQAQNPVLQKTWEPFDLAFGRYGRVYVADGANGAVHVFSASGQWQKCFSGIGPVTWIATDSWEQCLRCSNRSSGHSTTPESGREQRSSRVKSGRIGITVFQHPTFQLTRKVSYTSAHSARRHLGNGAPTHLFRSSVLPNNLKNEVSLIFRAMQSTSALRRSLQVI